MKTNYTYRIIAALFAMIIITACKKDGGTPINNEPPPSTTAKFSVTGITPKSGKPFTKITISGNGFGSNASGLAVHVNGQLVDPISVSPTAIVIETNLATTTGKIRVSRNNEYAFSEEEFTVLPEDLSITGYVSNEQLGRTVYIGGAGFGSDLKKIDISFGGTASVKPTTMLTEGRKVGVAIPRYAKEGKVTVTVNGVSVTGKEDLKFDMSVSDFTPKTAAAGDTIKFTGYKFTNTSDMYVTLDETISARVIKVTSTEMLVIVPTNAKTAYFYVSSNFGSMRDPVVQDGFKFTLKPTVSFNNTYLPAVGKVGDVVRIDGSFSGAAVADIGVSFGGSKAIQPNSISGSDIYVKIPSDAKTGEITISRTGYKTRTSVFSFTVKP